MAIMIIINSDEGFLQRPCREAGPFLYPEDTGSALLEEIVTF